MLESLVYILAIVSITCLVYAIYNIYCYFHINSFIKVSKENPDAALEYKSGINLWLVIIKKACKRKELSGTFVSKQSVIKRISKIVKRLIASTVAVALVISLVTGILSFATYQLNLAIQSISASITWLFNNDDCTCYALCTGNAEDDKKTSYELLFGPDEYTKLCESLNLMPEDRERFVAMHTNNPDGKTEGEFIIAHLTDDAVQCYKDIVGNNSKFMSSDHKDRTQMSDDELKADLIALLSDYKVNGRNPDCKCCRTAKKAMLKIKCQGEAHYVEGWSWDEIWGNKETTTETPSTSTNPISGFVPGNATGPYAVQLDDGSYYWYHQDGGHGCGCTYCGDWSARYWGSSDKGNMFGEDGCAVYSLAMAVSNLVGSEVTPTVALQKLGVDTSSAGTFNTSASSAFNGRAIKRQVAAETLATAYGLQVVLVEHTADSIDAVLSKGGYVWGSWVDANCKWCGNGSSHFMVIRKGDSDSYWCFTSCRGKCTSSAGKEGAIATMNYPLSKSECISAMTSGQLFGFINPNAGTNQTGQTNQTEPVEIKYSQEVYNKLSANPTYAGKALALSLVYAEIAPKYGVNTAYGLMANVWAEGTFSVVEYYFSSEHLFDFKLPSGGSTIKSESDVDYLLNWPTNSGETTLYRNSRGKETTIRKDSCGVGLVQWSFGRRIQVCNLYKQMVTDYSSDEQKMAAEIKMISSELEGGYSSVAAACQGQTAERCGQIFCMQYEKPLDKSNKQYTRGDVAAEIANIINN